jgi:hypothetical protein
MVLKYKVVGYIFKIKQLWTRNFSSSRTEYNKFIINTVMIINLWSNSSPTIHKHFSLPDPFFVHALFDSNPTGYNTKLTFHSISLRCSETEWILSHSLTNSSIRWILTYLLIALTTDPSALRCTELKWGLRRTWQLLLHAYREVSSALSGYIGIWHQLSGFPNHRDFTKSALRLGEGETPESAPATLGSFHVSWSVKSV